jgi:Spy/CpxP family protein refolding chaperone
MRATWRLALAVGLVGGLVAPALAQPGAGGFGGGPGLLLMNPGVQKELKLTDEQVAKVRDALAKVREDRKDDLEKLRDRDLPREDRAKLMQKINEANTKALEGILRADQSKRLKQITLQTRGAQAFNDPEVQKALKLTDEQKDKLQKIGQESGQKMRELFQEGGDAQEMMKKMAELRKETMTKAAGVLTDEQKKTWKEMTGSPFELRFEPRRRDS